MRASVNAEDPMCRNTEKTRPAAAKFPLAAGLAAMILMGLPLPSAWAQMAGANTYDLNKDHSRIRFSIGHFFVSSTEGQFTSFDGKMNFDLGAPERGKAIIHIASGSISTGNGARDDHLRTADFLDAAKYPATTFESASLVRLSDTAGKMTGTLSLHGVTRPITLNVTLLTPDLNADRLDFSADTVLKRSDYGMTNYPGVIGDDVTLTIEAEFDKER
jgi:polyisoprenoid-binding protein YceI